MTTIVSNSKEQPAVTLDKVHWESFTFKQPKPNVVKMMQGAYTLYGFDVDGNKVFDKESVGIIDDDLDALVITNHVVQGGSVSQFKSDHASEITNVNIDYLAGNISDAKLMAYMELIMARVAELKGKLTITGVE